MHLVINEENNIEKDNQQLEQKCYKLPFAFSTRLH